MSVATALVRAKRGLLVSLATFGVSLVTAGALHAQGVTTGAVRGRVIDQQGAPIAGASLQLVNRVSGTRYVGSTNAAGSYFIANVIVGPYAIEARAIGYRPAGRSDLNITLGQVADVELRLEAAAIEVEAISVTGQEDALLNRGRTGVTSLVSENLIQNLPSLQRNFNDFTRTSPLVNGNSIAGSADRYNALQIDGGSNGDLFGLNSSRGSPGGRNDSRPVSVEAIQEFQVLIAPFDVRQGGFTGGLVNAVTRSGTNEFHGSLFGTMQNDALQGDDSAGVAAPEFDRKFYGFSIGGPIIRNRFHFFVATEWRNEETPFNQLINGQVRVITRDSTAVGDSINRANVGITAHTAERVRQHAITNLGFDPGDWGRPIIPNPDRNIFVKLTGQLGSRTQAELAYNNVQSELSVLTHDPTNANPTRLREGYQYEAAGYNNTSQNTSLRGRLNSQLTRSLTNELIVSSYRIEDVRALPNRVSLMIVGGDVATSFLALGAERFSHLNTLDQKILEVANNLTYTTGAHVWTIGGRAERFKFNNGFFPASLGAWFFPDTTAFFAGAPTRYERALPGVFADTLNGRTDGPIADFVFQQYGGYLQDQWRVSRGLTLTFGLRADMTKLPQPAYNPLLDTINVLVGPRAGEDFGVRTDNRPTNSLLISPRFGFNYDVRGDQSTFVRGGVGVFSGRTPYVWASNAYTNTGLEQVQLTCTMTGGPGGTPNIPTFDIDPADQATACAGGSTLAPPRPAIVFFDENFKLPQSLRVALGVDRRLPMNMVATIDLLYTRALNQFLLEDINLVQQGFSTGEANRRLYATNTGNTLTQCRALGSTAAACGGAARGTGWTLPFDVLRQYNSNQDYSYSASFSLTKRDPNGRELSASYAYSRSFDLISPTSDISNSLINFSTLDGTLSNRNLRPSFFDTPHSIRLTGTTNLPAGFRLSLFYTGSSGRPYAYRYNTDVNGDGFSGNDLFYVPVNANDISLPPATAAADWTRLNNYIQSEKCLREQRGQIMRRNSCRNPWRAFLDARVAKSFNTMRGQNIELTLNAFNVLALLGVGGVIRSTSSNENLAILNRTGYSTAFGRGVYSLNNPFPVRNSQDVLASRWKVEMGARYNF